MARTYGDKFLLELRDADPTRIGVRLARLCVDANLPAAYVAKVLETSRTTVYEWFRGQPMKELNVNRVEAFMHLVTEDMQIGKLPVKNTREAKQYLSEMIGVQI
jgi:hypothetical protein